MLEELSIQNFALIDRLTISFSAGFNVLSGETGAGKSILVGALSLLHGARADTSKIRTGTEEARVAGTFRVSNPDALAWLAEHDLAAEEETVIIRRTVKHTGRGSVYIQSAPVTLAELGEFTSFVFDIHGQHEHQSLLSEDQHRRLLDRFAALEEEVVRLGSLFGELGNLKKHFERMEASERSRAREMDILQFAVQEIDEARLNPGEEEELESERRKLAQHEKLFAGLDELHDNLAENRGGALASLRAARQAMETVASIDDGLAESAGRLEDLFFELEDVSETVRDYRANFEFTPDRLEEVESRLAQIHRLEKKYGATISDILTFLEESREQLAGFETWEEDKERLTGQIREKEKAVLKLAGQISARRKKVAESLTERIADTIHALGMEKTRFLVNVAARVKDNGRPACGPTGMDQVSFLISPNPGEPMKGLADIASGGEVSRVMLALKSALAENDQIGSMVFDEIDAGIGGEVALAVGEHLSRLSREKQVLCITHLASIAVRADNHMVVEKGVRNERTVTDVRVVSDDARVDEIARMLAGDREGSASRNHAQELLAKYVAEAHGG